MSLQFYKLLCNTTQHATSLNQNKFFLQIIYHPLLLCHGSTAIFYLTDTNLTRRMPLLFTEMALVMSASTVGKTVHKLQK